MKILDFNASPRKNGNTAWTISKILESAAETGGQTQIRHSSELNISPCKGCLSCAQSDSCVIADDPCALKRTWSTR